MMKSTPRARALRSVSYDFSQHKFAEPVLHNASFYSALQMS